MNNAHLIAAFIGAVLSITIVFLTRRDHISPLVAVRWFLIALLVLSVSFFPGVVDWFGRQLGVGYPPILPVLVALGAAMVKILLMDIERNKMQVKIDRLVQRMAVLEHRVTESSQDGQNNSKRSHP
ncbi:DUF2304 domain-containing protein [Aestuariibacter halophilus]|uniref:DUF2304 domain-containing protein n=1 Tax=Fluctibacter halophilus TaxID=226011 RepID=A0ABS8G2Q6_9ALTE|nr:DUF2304 domain-containing protein [Aestuariibacter halophilus]MCC2614818.1 DUF2304 domain-containing protein [Aestuariibacter halophilus]